MNFNNTLDFVKECFEHPTFTKILDVHFNVRENKLLFMNKIGTLLSETDCYMIQEKGYEYNINDDNEIIILSNKFVEYVIWKDNQLLMNFDLIKDMKNKYIEKLRLFLFEFCIIQVDEDMIHLLKVESLEFFTHCFIVMKK